MNQIFSIVTFSLICSSCAKIENQSSNNKSISSKLSLECNESSTLDRLMYVCFVKDQSGQKVSANFELYNNNKINTSTGFLGKDYVITVSSEFKKQIKFATITATPLNMKPFTSTLARVIR